MGLKRRRLDGRRALGTLAQHGAHVLQGNRAVRLHPHPGRRLKGVAINNLESERDLSVMLDTRGEGRAQCDYALATQDTTADAIGWIETVDLSDIEVDPP